MFKIIDKTIHVTRGDIGSIEVTATKDDSEYVFSVGDVIRLNVFRKNNCKILELQKEVKVAEETTSVDINLLSENTKIGSINSKPVEYWYEIVLNPDTDPQTIVGYDEDGAKEFIIYPEGDGENEQ